MHAAVASQKFGEYSKRFAISGFGIIGPLRDGRPAGAGRANRDGPMDSEMHRPCPERHET